MSGAHLFLAAHANLGSAVRDIPSAENSLKETKNVLRTKFIAKIQEVVESGDASFNLSLPLAEATKVALVKYITDEFTKEGYSVHTKTARDTGNTLFSFSWI